MKILYPIELLLSSVFSFSYKLTGHYGYALILMSVCITLITTPIYLLADYWKNQEKRIQDLMKEDLDCIKSHYSKQKQFYLTQTAHRIYNYKAWYPLRTSFGILIEIPFFFAAFNVLSNFKGYNGVSFGPIKNLGSPDGLLWTINLLPIVMTLLNVISSIVYSRSFRLKANTQPFVLAAVFLLFLYDSPSALLIYWSFNNFFSLIKNIIIELSKKEREKFETVKLLQEVKKNRNIVIYILCTLLYISFTFIMSFDHHKIKYCFLLLSAVQAGLFIFFFVIKRRKLNIKYILAYCLYALASLAYFKRSNVFNFDSALVIICLLNCLLFYFLFREKTASVNPEKNEVILIPLLFSLIFTLLLPLQIYFVNKQEFPIIFSRIILTLGISFIISSFILFSFSFFLFKNNQAFLKCLLFCLILYFFNGLFLRLNAGMMSEFGFQNDSVITNPSASLFLKDFIVILFSIYIVNYLYSKKKNLIFQIYIVCITAFTFSIFTGAVKYKDLKVEVSSDYKEIPSDTKEIHTFTKTGKNVFVFMADMMNGNYMGRILKENPELKQTLSGFTWYEDCLSKASDTQTSMFTLYGGNDYSVEEFNKKNISARDNMRKAADTMLKPFAEDGWSLTLSSYGDYFSPDKAIMDNRDFHYYYVENAYKDYFAKKNNIELSSSNKTFLLQILPFYNLLPHSSKQFLYQKSNWNNPKLLLQERQIIACQYTSSAELIEEFINFTDEPKNQFKFIPTLITHSPWLYNKNLEIISKIDELEISDEDASYYAAQRSIKILTEIIKKLKENGAYDNTIIIFVSDHGNQLENNEICRMDIPALQNQDYHFHLSMAHTVLLIKGLDEKGDLTISDAQLQNSDICDYLMENVFNLTNNFSEYLKYDTINPRERSFSVDLYQKNDYADIKQIPNVLYKVKGPVKLHESWTLEEE